jgi:uncharacterized repeat protein (TIGR04138 family)
MLPSSDNPYRPPTADLELIRKLDDADDVFWSPGTVSIWVGSFPSIEAADAYFEETFHNDATPISQFAEDFGFRGYPSDCLEFHFEEPRPQPIADLLALCSFCESYAEVAGRAAKERGIETAQGLALLFNFDFRQGVEKPQENGLLWFLGAFPFQMETGTPWLDRLVAQTGRHPAAYLTVLDALRAMRGEISPEERIDGRALCEGIRRHVLATYEELARERLEQFGLVSSEVVGQIVAEMIAAKVLLEQEGDKPEEFAGVFRLEDWFEPR